MVVVGTFGPDNTYSGRSVTWDRGVFTIEGLGVTDLSALLQSDDAGQFTWASADTRAWAEKQANDAFWADAARQRAAEASDTPPAAEAVTPPVEAAPRTAGAPFALKPWMIAAAVAVLLVAGVVVALAMQPPRVEVDGPGVVGPGGGGGGSVNHAPVAGEDSYATAEDTLLTVAAPSGILANDSDTDGDVLSATMLSAPSHGTVTIVADGRFTYLPSPNYNGSDSFGYTLSDGRGGIDAGIVRLTITPVADTPVYTKHAEIKVSVMTINIPFIGPYGTINSFHNECEFYASSGGSVIGSRTHQFEITKSELSTLAIHKTKGRSSLVNGLVKRLEDAGWTVVGKGAFWYSIKLAK